MAQVWKLALALVLWQAQMSSQVSYRFAGAHSASEMAPELGWVQQLLA